MSVIGGIVWGYCHGQLSRGYCPEEYGPEAYCPGRKCPGILVRGNCPGDIVQRDIVRRLLSGKKMSGNIGQGNILSLRIFSGGYCPRTVIDIVRSTFSQAMIDWLLSVNAWNTWNQSFRRLSFLSYKHHTSIVHRSIVKDEWVL